MKTNFFNFINPVFPPDPFGLFAHSDINFFAHFLYHDSIYTRRKDETSIFFYINFDFCDTVILVEIFYSILSIFGGYLSSKLICTPGSRINRRLPKVKTKNVQILPSVKIIIRGRIIHLHHWFYYTILLCVSIFVSGGILDSWVARSFIVGIIAQGLRFPDRGIVKKMQ